MTGEEVRSPFKPAPALACLFFAADRRRGASREDVWAVGYGVTPVGGGGIGFAVAMRLNALGVAAQFVDRLNLLRTY